MASFQCTRSIARPVLSSPFHLNTAVQTHSFSTTISLPVKAKQQVLTRFSAVPPYPYGPRLWYKKSNFGLYGLQSVRFGNNVSERNEIKTRRRWYPNVHRKRLWSVALGRWVRTKVTTRVLRTIDKVGGLDEYLLGEKTRRIKELGPGGWAIRWRVMRTDAVRERMRQERVRLGLIKEDGTPAAEGNSTVVEEIVDEEDLGFTEEELLAREKAIDRALDEDAERHEKGIDGGVELENLDEVEAQAEKAETKLDQGRKRKW